MYYNPGLMMHSPGDNTFQAAHMLYFNRVGRTVMVLSISGARPLLEHVGVRSAVSAPIRYTFAMRTGACHSSVLYLRVGTLWNESLP